MTNLRALIAAYYPDDGKLGEILKLMLGRIEALENEAWIDRSPVTEAEKRRTRELAESGALGPLPTPPAQPGVVEGSGVSGAIREALAYHGIQHEFREDAIARARDNIAALAPLPSEVAALVAQTRSAAFRLQYPQKSDPLAKSVARDELVELAPRLASALELSERRVSLSVEMAQQALHALRTMADAIDRGGIDSQELPGEPEVGIAPYKWHEEWRYNAQGVIERLARAILDAMSPAGIKTDE